MRIRRSLRLRKFYHSMRQLQGGTFYSTLICIRSKCFFCCHTLPQTRIWRDHCGLRGHRFCRLNEQLQMLTGSLSFLQYFSIRPDLDHIAQRCPEMKFRRNHRKRINIHLKEDFILVKRHIWQHCNEILENNLKIVSYLRIQLPRHSFFRSCLQPDSNV